jgi:hypothetical protein
MPKSHQAYEPEFRRQMVELVRSGRTPEELSRELEPTALSICTASSPVAPRSPCRRRASSSRAHAQSAPS